MILPGWDGKALGKKVSGKIAGLRILFEATYEPGTRTAIVYENSEKICRSQLSTAKSERKPVMKAEENSCGSGENLSVYIPIEIHDTEGTLVCGSDQRFSLTIENGVKVAGFGIKMGSVSGIDFWFLFPNRKKWIVCVKMLMRLRCILSKEEIRN